MIKQSVLIILLFLTSCADSSSYNLSNGKSFELRSGDDTFLEILLPDGSLRYANSVMVHLSQDEINVGELVSDQGYILSPGIVIPANSSHVEITENGILQVTVSDYDRIESIGQIFAVKFDNALGLAENMDSTFSTTNSSGPPIYGVFGENGYMSLETISLDR